MQWSLSCHSNYSLKGWDNFRVPLNMGWDWHLGIRNKTDRLKYPTGLVIPNACWQLHDFCNKCIEAIPILGHLSFWTVYRLRRFAAGRRWLTYYSSAEGRLLGLGSLPGFMFGNTQWYWPNLSFESGKSHVSIVCLEARLCLLFFIRVRKSVGPCVQNSCLIWEQISASSWEDVLQLLDSGNLRAKKTICFGSGVSCSNCFQELRHFLILIQNYRWHSCSYQFQLCYFVKITKF